MEKRLFEIPDNSEVMAQLIEAVPSGWSWVDGYLSAPDQFIRHGKIALNSGFVLQRFHSIHPTIVGRKKDEERINPDFYSLIVERKLPEFITFDEAAFETSCEGLTMEVVKSIAIAYVRCHYRGGLRFYGGYRNNHKYDNPARCSINLVRWSHALFIRDEYPLEEYPSTVEVQWNREFGGEEKDVQPILLVCERLNLQELKPMLTSKEPAV
jgi:hypothetical protein